MTTPDPIERQGPSYAVVVVNTPLRPQVAAPTEVEPDPEDEAHLTRAFHYAVPESLQPQIRLGQLVWAPFGARFLQGVVVAFDDASPVAETRDIAQIVDSEPILSEAQIALAYWISAYYLAPIHQVILGMIPPGITAQTEMLVQAIGDAQPEGATLAQASLLALLRARGPLSLRQIASLTGKDGRRVADQLAAHGWAEKRVVMRPPRVRPKRVPVVRLAPAATAEDRPGARAAQQGRAFDYLLARADDGWLPRARVIAEADVPAAALNALIAKGLAEQDEREVWRDPLEGQSFVPVTPPRLTPDQEAAWEAIAADLEASAGKPFLLQGVTGSGKTEIYLRAVQRVLRQGRGAIVLAPEIALTPQTIRRFGARFPATLAVMHSQLSEGERYDQWRRIRSGDLRLVIGSRSAVFSPVRDLGLIVLDEEHEWTYKQEQTPRYHAREVASQLARITGATLILGSATPALESAYRAERGEYRHLALPQRILGHRQMVEAQGMGAAARFHALEGAADETLYADLPPVEVVDLRAELRAGNTGIFSRALREGIEAALAAGEQVILFLNRRGSATFVICRDCGYVLACPRCDVPYTYHADDEALVCHHCNRRLAMPAQCPACGGRRIRQLGIGTERVEEVVRQLYPTARTLRWDLDTTGGATSHEALLDRFIRGEADIMIGTQMIAKGLDLPRVTLVGVVTADTLLHLPDLRSGERTFQLLTQVAGRAGRSALGGRVIVQTYTPEHPAIQAASRHDYAAFYEAEMAFRRAHWYPPLSRLVRLVYLHATARRAQSETARLTDILAQRIQRLGLAEVDLIGPAPCFFARERGKWRWQLLVRGREPQELLRDVHLPLGWRVDVDPQSVV
jgi:primosomal protein N' (replication factor Y)